MQMIDKNFNELKEGQKVQFALNLDKWRGKVMDVDNSDEKILIEVTDRETGVGLTETMNHIECRRYLTII